QKKQFKELQMQGQKLRPQMQKSRMKSMSMSQYLSDKSFDKQKFIEDQTKMMSARIAMRAENFEKRYNILNDKQKIEFAKMLKERDERMANRMENMQYMFQNNKSVK
ncbi:MAG: hypothetical protein P8Y43_07335, partial [Sulfurovaceae bacterium]